MTADRRQTDPPLVPPNLTETVAPVQVQSRKPVSIAPPLDGPNWLDANSCCDMTAHRMAANPINGQICARRTFRDRLRPADPGLPTVQRRPDEAGELPVFRCADIHAVADGPVVAVLDGLPEQVPGKTPSGLPLDQYGGNHIVQDIGDGNYAFYAHLKTGSVAVKPGDDLKPGR